LDAVLGTSRISRDFSSSVEVLTVEILLAATLRGPEFAHLLRAKDLPPEVASVGRKEGARGLDPCAAAVDAEDEATLHK